MMYAAFLIIFKTKEIILMDPIYIYIYIYIYVYISQVVSYERFLKWYLIPPCLTLSNKRYVSRVKWSNPRKEVSPSPTPWCSGYWKGSLLVTLDYGRQIYFYIYKNHSIYIYIYIYWIILPIYIYIYWNKLRQIHLPRKQCLINQKRHQHTANEGMDSYW